MSLRAVLQVFAFWKQGLYTAVHFVEYTRYALFTVSIPTKKEFASQPEDDFEIVAEAVLLMVACMLSAKERFL